MNRVSTGAVIVFFPTFCSMQDRASSSLGSKTFLACGVLAGPLFVLVFVLAGLGRAGYDPLRHPISSLAIGPEGWPQTVNFLVTGGLLLAFAFGLRGQLTAPVRLSLRASSPGRIWGIRWMRMVGIGFLGAGVFCTDAVYGFPPEQPLALAQFSWHGHLHDLFSLLVFVGLPGACFVFARRFWRAGRRVAGWQACGGLACAGERRADAGVFCVGGAGV
jgi:hypothetical protein